MKVTRTETKRIGSRFVQTRRPQLLRFIQENVFCGEMAERLRRQTKVDRSIDRSWTKSRGDYVIWSERAWVRIPLSSYLLPFSRILIWNLDFAACVETISSFQLHNPHITTVQVFFVLILRSGRKVWRVEFLILFRRADGTRKRLMSDGTSMACSSGFYVPSISATVDVSLHTFSHYFPFPHRASS